MSPARRSSVVGWLLVAALELCTPAQAAPPPVRVPDGVLAQVSAASAQAELSSLKEALARFRAPTSTLDSTALVSTLEKAIGAKRLVGVDLMRPVHVLVLDPKRFAQSVIVVLETKNVAELKHGLRDSPTVGMRSRKNVVALGEETALVLAAEYALGLRAPEPGLHGLVYLDRVWALFGAQARAMQPMLAAAASPRLGQPSADVGKVLESLFVAFDQVSQLAIAVRASRGGFEARLDLSAKAATPMSTLFSAQRPSDFALLGKLAWRDPVSIVAAGTLDMSSVQGWMRNTALAGNGAPTEAETKDRDALVAALTGNLAFIGDLVAVDKLNMQYLLGVRDVRRVLDLLPRLQVAFTQMRAPGLRKVTIDERTTTRDGDLNVDVVKLRYELSQLPGETRKPPIESESAWTGWDGLVAMAAGSSASSRLHDLIGSAHAGKGGYVPPAGMADSLTQARAAKDSFWLAIDPGATMKALGKSGALSAITMATIAIGFSSASARLRIAVEPGVPTIDFQF